MSFRPIIQDELRRRGWSGYRLAKEAGLPKRTVQVYLNGSHDMLAENFAVLCKTLDLELRPIRKRRKHGKAKG